MASPKNCLCAISTSVCTARSGCNLVHTHSARTWQACPLQHLCQLPFQARWIWQRRGGRRSPSTTCNTHRQLRNRQLWPIHGHLRGGGYHQQRLASGDGTPVR